MPCRGLPALFVQRLGGVGAGLVRDGGRRLAAAVVILVAGGAAVPCRGLPALFVQRRVGRAGRRVGPGEGGEIGAEVAQFLIRQVGRQRPHDRIGAAPVAEEHQLPLQVAFALAGERGDGGIGGDALRAMADDAGFGALAAGFDIRGGEWRGEEARNGRERGQVGAHAGVHEA